MAKSNLHSSVANALHLFTCSFNATGGVGITKETCKLHGLTTPDAQEELRRSMVDLLEQSSPWSWKVRIIKKTDGDLVLVAIVQQEAARCSLN